jgi:hypothetical protein
MKNINGNLLAMLEMQGDGRFDSIRVAHSSWKEGVSIYVEGLNSGNTVFLHDEKAKQLRDWLNAYLERQA